MIGENCDIAVSGGNTEVRQKLWTFKPQMCDGPNVILKGCVGVSPVNRKVDGSIVGWNAKRSCRLKRGADLCLRVWAKNKQRNNCGDYADPSRNLDVANSASTPTQAQDFSLQLLHFPL